jgi:hypothetical protein
MPIEIIDGNFRVRLEQLLGARRDRTWLAAPFLTLPIAEWIAARPAALHGDRRLLIAWASRSISSLYLSAHGVEVLQTSGFQVRDLRNLHAKAIIAGTRAYVGSGNLTGMGLFGRNTEVGVFTDGRGAASAAKLFEDWWSMADVLTPQEIERAKTLQESLAGQVDRERQPGHEPTPSIPVVPHYWIKVQYDRPTGLRIKPGQRHWISDPGNRDANGKRLHRQDGEPYGKPSYRIGDFIGLYPAPTLKVPTIVEVKSVPHFNPKFVQENAEGGEPDAGEKWPWVTEVEGKFEASIDNAPDIDQLGIRGPIQWGRPYFTIAPETYRKLLLGLGV